MHAYLVQQTRLGKYVNEMRRRTADRSLARRAKDLVRKWQQLVANQSSSFPTVASVAVPLTPGTMLDTESSTSLMPSGSGDPSVCEINRVASSGSLVDPGSYIPPSNSIRPLSNQSLDSPHSRFSANEDLDIEKHSGFSASEVSECRYQPPQSKIGSSVVNSFVRSPPSTSVTVASFQYTTSLSHLAAPSSVCTNNIHSPQLTNVSAKLPIDSASLIDSSELPSMYLHCITNGTTLDTGSSTSLTPSRSTDALFNVKHKYSNGYNGMLKASSSSSNLVHNGTWSIHGNAEATSVTADSMASSPDLLQADAPLARLKIKINRTSATESISSPVASSIPMVIPASAARKTQKVVTTAELIQRLHANGELRLVASETLNRIATNQIEHEADDSNVSVVPDGAKPRPHKRRRTDRLPDQLPPAMTDTDLLQVKAERVRNFVEMSADASSTVDNNDLLSLLGHLSAPSYTTAADVMHCAEQLMVPTNPVSASLDLPSLTDFEINWDSNTYIVSDSRPPPTEDDVDRLLREQWPSVNGQYDHRGEWTDWTQSYSAPSYDSSLIHILPYIDIDD